MIIRIQSPKIMVSLDCYKLVSGTQQEHESTTDRPTYDKECHAFEVHTKSYIRVVSHASNFASIKGPSIMHICPMPPLFSSSLPFLFPFHVVTGKSEKGIEHKTL